MRKTPRLYDSQWLNIVNAHNCYAQFTKEEAVHAAVKATEEAMHEYFCSLDSKWTKERPTIEGWYFWKSFPAAAGMLLHCGYVKPRNGAVTGWTVGGLDGEYVELPNQGFWYRIDEPPENTPNA